MGACWIPYTELVLKARRPEHDEKGAKGRTARNRVVNRQCRSVLLLDYQERTLKAANGMTGDETCYLYQFLC